jgi:hypothetical protein
MTIVSKNIHINQISIVIPSSNDDDKLNLLIGHILVNSKPSNIKDIIIVRNGDFTTNQTLVPNNKIKVLYCSKQQRAAAMNFGARVQKVTYCTSYMQTHYYPMALTNKSLSHTYMELVQGLFYSSLILQALCSKYFAYL